MQMDNVHIRTCRSHASASYPTIPELAVGSTCINHLTPSVEYVYLRFREHVNITNLPGIVDAVAVWCEYIRYLEAVCIARIDCNIGTLTVYSPA